MTPPIPLLPSPVPDGGQPPRLLDRFRHAALERGDSAPMVETLVTPPGPQPIATELPGVSILIQARNEEQSIAVKAALAREGMDLEVIVLDDHTCGRTAAGWPAAGDGASRLVIHTMTTR